MVLGSFGGKLVFTVFVTWFSTLGSLRSDWTWRDYLYKNTIIDRPLTEVMYGLPPKLRIGSPKHMQFQKMAAMEQIRIMREAGIDAVLMAVLPRTEYDIQSFRKEDMMTYPVDNFFVLQAWLDAAREDGHGFRVGIYLGRKHPKGGFPSVKQWAQIISKLIDRLGDHPNLLRFNKLPCFIHFSTSKYSLSGAAKTDVLKGWDQILSEVRKSGRNLYFVPELRPTSGKNLKDWAAFSDAIHTFQPQASLPKSIRFQNTLKRMADEFDKPYLWSVFPGMIKERTRRYLEPSFMRYHQLWLGAFKSNSPAIMILTWNDMNERTAIWRSILNDDVWIQLSSFYISWFKSGNMPQYDRDMIFVSFPVQIGNKMKSRSLDATGRTDNCYYWAYTTKGLLLEIPGVGKVQLKKGFSTGEVGKVKEARAHVIVLKDNNKIYHTRSTRKITSGKAKKELLEYFYIDVLKK